MDFTEKCVKGMEDVLAPLEIVCVAYVSLLFVIAFVSIVLIRKSILQRLQRLSASISSSNEKLQYALLKALTYQACLPAFLLLSVSAYTLCQLSILNNYITQYSILLVGVSVTVFSPLPSLYYIKPYHDYVATLIPCNHSLPENRADHTACKGYPVSSGIMWKGSVVHTSQPRALVQS
ncbi:hypothetical protein Aduo_011925 [Ancylostoma duodenale]